jgi:hypothetical protein
VTGIGSGSYNDPVRSFTLPFVDFHTQSLLIKWPLSAAGTRLFFYRQEAWVASGLPDRLPVPIPVELFADSSIVLTSSLSFL